MEIAELFITYSMPYPIHQIMAYMLHPHDNKFADNKSKSKDVGLLKTQKREDHNYTSRKIAADQHRCSKAMQWTHTEDLEPCQKTKPMPTKLF